jgi:hypothetical protein
VSAWPPAAPDRLADALTALAGRVAERDVRAQLHSLAAVLRNLGGEAAGAEERLELERALAAAVAAADEPRAVAALRDLTRLNREAVGPVDWSAATGG